MLKTALLSISIEFFVNLAFGLRLSAFNNILAATTNRIANGSKTDIKDNIIKEYENCTVANFNLQFYKRLLKALNIDPKTICSK